MYVVYLKGRLNHLLRKVHFQVRHPSIHLNVSDVFYDILLALAILAMRRGTLVDAERDVFTEDAGRFS